MSTPGPSVFDRRLVFLEAGGPGPIDPSSVGSKAANLIRLAEAGLPVPPGFVLSTAVCADYHRRHKLDPEVAELIENGMARLERDTGRQFGASRRPLLVAVRSGAPVSMPGMLDTILDVGLCDVSLPGLLTASGEPAFVWDSYRRLVQSYAEVVEGCRPGPFRVEVDAALAKSAVPEVSELDVASLRELVSRLQVVYHSLTGRPFPQDPHEQLFGAVEAVLRSWNSERAVEYRRLEGLSGLPGTAVTVQAMVFGNRGLRSGSGVAFTRDPATGRNEMYLDFVPNVQGEDVVAGREPVAESGALLAAIPGVVRQLESVRRALEELFTDAQDFEFTIEDGRLWLLQTRTAKRTALAALQIACDQVDEGLIDPAVALERLDGYDLDQIRVSHLECDLETEPAGSATPASTGVASGVVALDLDTAVRLAGQTQPVILVREHATTSDIAALAVCRGVLTATGSRTSHAAVVARQLGVVCLVNCADLSIDPTARRLRIGNHHFQEQDPITLDGSSGLIYPGLLRVTEDRPSDLLERVRAWQTDAVDAGRLDRGGECDEEP
jgi:pyruvate, orthophosphate dikinase